MTYAESIALNLKDKLVQIYFGDVYEETFYADNSVKTPSVLIGKVVGAEGECLILNCFFRNDDGENVLGNVHYLNSINIQAITELDGNGTIKDAISSSNALKNLGNLK